jgi:methylmalonyl-CoA/ethylmalonyl-CoA epimerase
VELTQVAQRATDLDRAAAFYADLLGEEPVARFDPPGLLFFRLGATRLLLDRAAPSALLYLRVTGLQDKVDELGGRAVEVVTEPHQIFVHDDDSLGPAGHEEWQAFVRDSEGNVVGLVELVAPSP